MPGRTKEAIDAKRGGPRSVTLRIMRFLGDGPDAKPYDVVVFRIFDGNALVGMFAHGKTPKTDDFDLAFTMVVPVSQLSEIP